MNNAQHTITMNNTQHTTTMNNTQNTTDMMIQSIEQDLRTILRISADLMLTNFNIEKTCAEYYVAEIRLGPISTIDALAIQYELIHAWGIESVNYWVVNGNVEFSVMISPK